MVPALIQTGKLVGLSFLVFTALALTLGVAAALAKGSVLDRVINFIGLCRHLSAGVLFGPDVDLPVRRAPGLVARQRHVHRGG